MEVIRLILEKIYFDMEWAQDYLNQAYKEINNDEDLSEIGKDKIKRKLYLSTELEKEIRKGMKDIFLDIFTDIFSAEALTKKEMNRCLVDKPDKEIIGKINFYAYELTQHFLSKEEHFKIAVNNIYAKLRKGKRFIEIPDCFPETLETERPTFFYEPPIGRPN